MIFRVFILIWFSGLLFLSGQANTEVYLFDLTLDNGKPILSNPKNISNNEGYDNQPSFWDNNTLLFSSTRADQTDILKFNINKGSTSTWISDTPLGSEYSPLKMPGKDAISSIRLDLDGLQLLYEYDIDSGESKPISDLKIGYHVWYNEHVLVSSVLVEDRLDLVVTDLKNKTNRTLQKNVGRSLHKIPGTDLISFISKANKVWEIRSINPISGDMVSIAKTYGKEDICWLNNNLILTGNGKSLLMFETESESGWQEIMQFSQEEINNITRIAVNPAKTRLAFVAEESPKVIVQKQLDAYNARNIEAFMDTYSEDVKLYNFPNDLISEGKEKMKKQYNTFFENTPDLHCQIKNRIVMGNKVIDEEFVTINGSQISTVAIYEVQNGKIIKVTFID
ncbi:MULTISPECIES: nuclear transport factor 2 family protein [Flavobacteriaceae]|uniref:nuclear transport factor 2 family protein n=1 Tax=Flavobacteriaceae TaxID=49546 RepID=UPI001491C7FE|nr:MULTISPECIES: nuclear transport factor 2 family protein [Allomuricauda]MDC6365094.1 nuclear transport factor 2 family protein [Muricauda sp. AC10]